MGIIERERQVCAANYAPIPVVITRGEGVWLTDDRGRRHLDMMSAYSAVSLGHAHPAILAAMTRQASRIAVTSRAFHADTLAPFLECLTARAGLPAALPMNTGAEAVETAIKAARRWGYRRRGIAPGRAEIIVADGNFHGRTTTIAGFSGEPDYKADFGPFTPGFVTVPFGDAEAARAAIGPFTAAILVEPIQGEAGIIVPPAGYLRALRSICDEAGILLIFDEIQSGLGRTGRWFAFEHEDALPDGLILGKALGGGVYPVSAFLATRDVMDQFEPGSHGSTFGGNALAAAIGLAALQTIEREGLVERSARLGALLMARLEALGSPAIREIRGRGLWIGVEIDPAVASARALCEALAAEGVLTKDTHGTVLRFAPPLTITEAEIDWAMERIARVFDRLGSHPPLPRPLQRPLLQAAE